MAMSLLEEKRLSQHSLDVIDALQTKLPFHEWRAVECWLSTFYNYQLEWLLDWRRRSLLNKARQIGASHTYAAAAVLWALLGETTTVVSVGEREALEVLDKAALHAEALRRLGSKWLRVRRQAGGLLSFYSSGRVLALPATSGGRSFSGNVLLDEFAYHGTHAKAVWDGASGTVTHKGKLRVMSTPNGVGNLWHEIFTDPAQHKGYKLHQVTLQQAIDDGLSVSIDDCWAQARNDPRVFDQLFNCSFLGGEFQYLPTEAINACSTDDLYTYDGFYYGGLDIGRSADKTVLIVVRKDPDTGVRTMVRMLSFKRTDSDLLDKIVAEAFRKYNLKRFCVDASGMGSFPVDRMRKRHGRQRVEGVTFTLQSKEELATGLYSAFTDQTVKIPKTDHGLADLQLGAAVQLRQDLCSIRRETTAAGNVRYDAPHTDKGHADSAWALALALHASGGPNRRRHEVNLSGGPENIY
jgi:phage FluMu gp28-like protein